MKPDVDASIGQGASLIEENISILYERVGKRKIQYIETWHKRRKNLSHLLAKSSHVFIWLYTLLYTVTNRNGNNPYLFVDSRNNVGVNGNFGSFRYK